MHIAIEGTIGSGKTTIARALAAKLGGSFVGEDAEANPFLSKFYSDPEKYALETELTFLLIHFHQLLHCRAQRPLISDFTLGKDFIFARMNLQGADISCFEELYRALQPRVNRPDVVALLDCSPELSLQRVHTRGIANESSVTIDYLRRLRSNYMANIAELGARVVLVRIEDGDGVDVIVERVCAVIQS